MQAYRIVDWRKRYEVTKKGRKAVGNEPMAELRKTPLDYLRSKNYGHSIGPALQYILDNAWRDNQIFEWSVFGLFQKMLEIAADQEREYRGWLLDKDQMPIYAAQIAKMFRSNQSQLFQDVLDILCNPAVRWLELAEFPDSSGRVRNVPAVTGDLYKETEEKIKITETKEDSDAAHDVSDSAATLRDEVIMQVCRLLRIDPNNKSDITTLRDIFDQITAGVERGELDMRIYERVIIEAKEAASHRFGKRGRFVNAMKRVPFNYVPVQRVVPGGRFSTVRRVP